MFSALKVASGTGSEHKATLLSGSVSRRDGVEGVPLSDPNELSRLVSADRRGGTVGTAREPVSRSPLSFGWKAFSPVSSREGLLGEGQPSLLGRGDR